eukprot:m51a1_g1660 putative intraflagellar transport protein 88 homolog (724) ;mRNA; f:371243-373940
MAMDPYSAVPDSEIYDFTGVSAPAAGAAMPAQDEFGQFPQPVQAAPTATAGPTTARPQSARPITSMQAAGFTAAAAQQVDLTGARQPVGRPQAVTAEEIARFIEESAFSNKHGDLPTALKKAKHAGILNKKLEAHRQASGILDPNIDLTYCVHFNLACQFEANKMYDEAIKTYKFIVSQKHYVQAGRLRINIGNIYYEQEKFPEAVKQYKMALDQLPLTAKELRFKVERNIANAYIRTGRLQNAVQALESIMAGAPDPRSSINLVVCYYFLKDKERMKHAFILMLMYRKSLANVFKSDAAETPASPGGTLAASSASLDVDGGGPTDEEPRDDLYTEKRARQKKLDSLIINAAQLIAPEISKDFASGFDWIIETLHQNMCTDAIETLKGFEKKDHNMASPASTNLSFLYFLENELQNAEKYADLALNSDRYNSKALVNKGNCVASKGDLAGARDLYLDALGIDSDCVEAIYNLGLVYKRLGDMDMALQSFHKLHTILPHDKEVLCQIALLNEKAGNITAAIKWYKLLNTLTPSDPGVLAKLGTLYSKTDDAIAYQYYMESYRFFPANLHVVSWLGAYYVKSEAHEKAVPFFQRAWQLQPNEIQWQLMVGMCHKRVGAYQQALEIYQEINRKHPENVECLRALVQLATDLGLKEDLQKYAGKLRDIEQTKLQLEQDRKQLQESQGAADDYGGYDMGAATGMQMGGAKKKDDDEWAEVDLSKMLPS